MNKSKNTKEATGEKKSRKARTAPGGGPTNIAIARKMLLEGTTMKKIEEVTGDTSYAAVRQLEAEGYTFDKTQRDGENRIFYKAVASQEVKKAA